MRVQLHFFLCLVKIESGDFGFAVGHYLFSTTTSMASSWWYFTNQLLFHLLPYGRDILLGPSLARPISRSLIVLAVTHCIVFTSIIYMGVKLILTLISAGSVSWRDWFSLQR